MSDKFAKKQVKVDNWGMFFLQRLQQHFGRNEFCDFTLQFSNNENIKAHRLVLDVCTEYFQMLEKQGLVTNNVINMPDDMPSDVVIPVINFMYTGRLEFRSDIQERLYLTAQKMKMTVLTKLLDAQSLNTQPVVSPENKVSAARIAIKKALPPGSFTNLQGKMISPRVVDPNLPRTLPGKKLPIWTRRTLPTSVSTQISHQSFADFDRPIRIITTAVDQTPRPTRFEWPDDGDDDAESSPLAFEDISYESKPLMQLKEATYRPMHVVNRTPPVSTLKQRTATFEEVLRTGAVTKRTAPVPPLGAEAAKKSKMLDLQAVKEYVQETQVRKNMLDKEDSDDDVDNDLSTVDHDYDDDDDIPLPHAIVPHKSILKQTSHDEDTSTTSTKKVRFSLEADSASLEEKENSTSTATTTTITAETKPTPLPTRSTCNQSSGSSVTTPTNHAKIITEVLKKYPHLVKNNKNIRLKIMQRGGMPSQLVAMDTDASGRKAKVSYVVLKSDVLGGKGKPAFGLKQQGGGVEKLTTFDSQSKPVSGAENIAGPWLCHMCGISEEPVNFETYYLYRHHLQDVHNEKIDARICEHCGHRASKRNLLLYHMYTKHGVDPPRNCQFPRCDQCDYVALSESLLVKHRNNHAANRDFGCKTCHASFKTSAGLHAHMQTNLHNEPIKKSPFECPLCLKPFVNNNNLQAHISVSHKELAKQLPTDDDMQLEEIGDHILEEEGVMEVPVINMTENNAAGMTVIAEAPGLEPSSEAEGLSHVATGIATSLGLVDGQQAVILLDENQQEYIIHTTELAGNEYVQEQEELHEYIVPEMMSEEQEPQQEEEMEEGYTEEQPVHDGTEEVLMVLTDHCYAEEVVSKNEVREPTVEAVEALEVKPKAETMAIMRPSVEKMGKPIEELMDDWGDEEMSDEVVVASRDALPTRGEIYVDDRAMPTRETAESELVDGLFTATEELLRTDLGPRLIIEENSQESTVSEADQFAQEDIDDGSQSMETDESAPSQIELNSSFPDGLTENATFGQDSEQDTSLSQETRENLTFEQKTEESDSFSQGTEHATFTNVTELGQTFSNAATFPHETTDQLTSFSEQMERDCTVYQGATFESTTFLASNADTASLAGTNNCTNDDMVFVGIEDVGLIETNPVDTSTRATKIEQDSLQTQQTNGNETHSMI